MKINSNTIKLEGQDYKSLESVITKIAAENKVNNVESVEIKLTANEGMIIFKTAQASLIAPLAAGATSGIASSITESAMQEKPAEETTPTTELASEAANK
jgi:hypothetical protein